MTWDSVRLFAVGCLIEVLYLLGRPVIHLIDLTRRKP